MYSISRPIWRPSSPASSTSWVALSAHALLHALPLRTTTHPRRIPVAMPSQKAKEKQVAEPAQEHEADEGEETGSEGSEDESAGPSLPESSVPSSSKKKKKKRSKALKALNALRQGGKDDIPDELVNTVLQKVREEGGEVAQADAATVRLALEQMKIKDVIQGKTGVGGKNKKDMGNHKVRVITGSRDAQDRSMCFAVSSSGERSLSLNLVREVREYMLPLSDYSIRRGATNNGRLY